MKLNANTYMVLKRCETCGITYEICDYFLEYTNFQDDLIKYKYLCCCKNYQKQFDEKFRETNFKYIQIFYDKNTFVLFLQKGFIIMSIWMIGKN